jgi:hypothetical protein
MIGGKKDKKPGGATGKGFQPGESGNPSGRTKGTVSFKRILQEKLGEVWDRDYLKRTALELIADQLLYQAIVKKSRHAISEIMDRTDGKPAQALTLDANLNVSRDQRTARLEELLATFPALPDANEHSDAKPN